MTIRRMRLGLRSYSSNAAAESVSGYLAVMNPLTSTAPEAMSWMLGFMSWGVSARADDADLAEVERESAEAAHRFVAHGKSREASARAQHVDRRAQGLRAPRGVDHDVRAFAAGEAPHFLHGLVDRPFDDVMRAHSFRHLELPASARDGDHRRAGEHRETRMQQACGALAQHDHRFSGGDAHAMLSVAHRGERFDDRRLLQRQARR